MIHKVVFIVALLFVGNSYQQSKPSDDFYYAAVVEYYRIVDSITGYMRLLNTPEAKQADIIVFPEATLNKFGPTDVFVPHHNESVTPCGNSTYDFLADFSCKAKEMKKYLVLNLFEKERCTLESQKAIGDPRPCPKSGWYKFNTNVVLDRNGTVIARYRKVHLYVDPGIDKTYKPDIVTFETDFGVKFGTFICFDILFETPGQNLVRDLNVTDIAYPVYWHTQLPFFSALQAQQAWAYANNVNLLASGGNDPKTGTTGTGIYSGKYGALTGFISSSVVSEKIFLAKVPKIGRPFDPLLKKEEVVGVDNIRNIALGVDEAMPLYKSEIVEFHNESEVTYKLCQKEVCCTFEITKTVEPWKLPNSYVFRVGVLNARMERFGEGSLVKNCGLYACRDYSVDSCGQPYLEDSKVNKDVFKKIVITGDFPLAKNALIQPNTVDRILRPVTTDKFDFTIKERSDGYKVVMRSLSSIENIYNFGIFGNYYNNSGSGILPAVILLLVGTLFNIIY